MQLKESRFRAACTIIIGMATLSIVLAMWWAGGLKWYEAGPAAFVCTFVAIVGGIYMYYGEKFRTLRLAAFLTFVSRFLGFAFMLALAIGFVVGGISLGKALLHKPFVSWTLVDLAKLAFALALIFIAAPVVIWAGVEAAKESN